MALSCRALLTSSALAAAVAATAPGCAPEGGAGEAKRGSGGGLTFQSFEEFRASVYREPWQGGAYIVEGDIPIFDDDALRAYYDKSGFGGAALVLGTDDGTDLMWNGGERLQLKYCLDGSFSPAEKEQAVRALSIAGARWEAIADVRFIYDSKQDAACGAGNNQVTFNVTKVQTNEAYFARAFFPRDSRERRQLNIDALAFEPVRQSTVDDVMTHEFGHILGFRHEHGRNEAKKDDPGLCTEGNDGWHAVTRYDDKSVMAYPECAGYISGEFVISESDEVGAAAVYGTPGRLQPNGAEPVTYRYDWGTIFGFTPRIESFKVKGGSTFVAVLKGATGNDLPNLFVNVGSEANPGQADCQPQIDNEAPETCRIEVPPGPGVEIFLSLQPGNGAAQAHLGMTVVYVPNN